MQALCQLSYSPETRFVGNYERVPARLLGLRYGWRPFDQRSVTPESFQVVIVTGGRLKEVNHHVAVIKQDPFGLSTSFVSQRFAPVSAQMLFNPVGQRLHLGTGGPGGDDKDLGDYEEVANLQKNNVLALLVGYGIGSQPSDGHCVDGLNLLAQRARIGGTCVLSSAIRDHLTRSSDA
jgi:hypothetical protein